MKVEETELLPVCLVLVRNGDILEIQLVGRDVNLDVFAALELKVFSLREFDCEFLDEGCYIVVADDFTFELLD